MRLLKDTEFVCLDCETTGLDIDNDRVIEIALVKFTFDSVISSFETLVDPKQKISQESIRIHHICEGMLQGQPTIEQVFPKILEFFKGDPLIVGHNVQFDLSVLEKESGRVGKMTFPSPSKIIDTLRLAKDYGNSPGNSLETLAKHFNLPIEDSHRAMSDVKTNIGIFKHLSKRYKTLENLFEVLSKPIKMRAMPLGKHKGRPFSEIPVSYLRWAVNMNFDSDLLYSIRSELKQRQKGTPFLQANNPFIDL